MDRKRRRLPSLIVLLLLLVGLPAFLVWREVRQQNLDAALIAAIKAGDTETALEALAHGADPNARDTGNHKPSFATAIRQLWNRLSGRRTEQKPGLHPTAIQRLYWIEEETEETLPSPPENLPALKALLKHGANPNVRDAGGRTPLCCALLWEYPAAMTTLLAAGADPNLGEPVITAVKSRKPALLKLLLDQGANPNVGEGEERPLTSASWSGDVEMVRLLLAKGADPNYREDNSGTANGNDYSAMYAARHEYYTTRPGVRETWGEIIRLLKQYGAK